MVVYFKDFHDVLVENLNNYKGVYASFIDHAPNLYQLLCDILDTGEVDDYYKLAISAAIAYFVIPRDIIPEQFYDPYGYIDDIFISVYILRDVADEYGYDFLQNLWRGNENIQEVMDECYEKSLEILDDEKIQEIINYVGLKALS